jgi:hypothetical protein
MDNIYHDAEPFLKTLLDNRTHDTAIKNVRIGPAYDLQNLGPSETSGVSEPSTDSAHTTESGSSTP